MHISTKERYHFVSTRMTIIKLIISSVSEDAEIRTSYTAGGNIKKVQCSHFGKQSGSLSKG